MDGLYTDNKFYINITMHPDLEKLIELVVADGQITEKERSVVVIKAIELGVDTDEAEIYMDGRLHQVNQINKQVVFPAPPLEKKSTKEGNEKKCPACGATVESFTINCKECGHEFRNTSAVSSIIVLSSLLDAILNEGTKDKYEDGIIETDTKWERIGKQQRADRVARDRDGKRAHRQAQTIVNFPIPNNKEDILEFLAVALPKGRPRGFWNNTLHFEDILQPAWKTKCEEIIIKARFSMKDDKKILDQIEFYAKELKIK